MKKINIATRQLLIFGCAILLLTGLTACSGNVYNSKSEDSSQGTVAESNASGTESEDAAQDESYEFQVEIDEDSTESAEFSYSFSGDAY